MSGGYGTLVVFGVYNDGDRIVIFAAARTIEGPPISIFSIIASWSAPDATVSAKGYRFTTTRSKGFNIEFVEGVDMLLLAAVGQNTGVDARVQGLHGGPSRHSGGTR